MRIAGAQIPVGLDIQRNKREILKAIDWAKENEVDHLLTPEGSLSGYQNGWQPKEEEIREALNEILEFQKGIGLHLGTMFREKLSDWDITDRNEIRHYDKLGELSAVTYKTHCIPHDRCMPRYDDTEPLAYFEVEPDVTALGMICNDMWGSAEEDHVSFCDNYLLDENVPLIFHATNGLKWNVKDKRQKIFSNYSEAFLGMVAFKSQSTILTVDSCVNWDWDGDESKIDECITSSPSGVINYLGWQTNVPRQGRQFFYCDVDLNMKESYQNYGREMSKTYPYVNFNL